MSPWPSAMPTSIEVTLLVIDATGTAWPRLPPWKYSSSATCPCRTTMMLVTPGIARARPARAFSESASNPSAAGAATSHFFVGQVSFPVPQAGRGRSLDEECQDR